MTCSFNLSSEHFIVSASVESLERVILDSISSKRDIVLSWLNSVVLSMKEMPFISIIAGQGFLPAVLDT